MRRCFVFELRPQLARGFRDTSRQSTPPVQSRPARTPASRAVIHLRWRDSRAGGDRRRETARGFCSFHAGQSEAKAPNLLPTTPANKQKSRRANIVCGCKAGPGWRLTAERLVLDSGQGKAANVREPVLIHESRGESGRRSVAASQLGQIIPWQHLPHELTATRRRSELEVYVQRDLTRISSNDKEQSHHAHSNALFYSPAQ